MNVTVLDTLQQSSDPARFVYVCSRRGHMQMTGAYASDIVSFSRISFCFQGFCV